MKAQLDTIILFVKDVDLLKRFYCEAFQCEVLEELPSEWVLLKAGHGKLGLHKTGDQYRNEDAENVAGENNCKMVFAIDEDIRVVRERLLFHQALMREVKNFPGHPYTVCDGADPEGNVFQLKQMTLMAGT